MVSTTSVLIHAPLRSWGRPATVLLGLFVLLLPAFASPGVTFHGSGGATSVGLGTVAVGSTSATASLGFSIHADVTVANIVVLTSGAANKDRERPADRWGKGVRTALVRHQQRMAVYRLHFHRKRSPRSGNPGFSCFG
jgi:hypothetical protein